MADDIRKVTDLTGLIDYFAHKLYWNINIDDFDDIDDITYGFEASDIGLKDEAFAKITSLRQLPPIVDGQKWGIFCVEFSSPRFEVSALRKVLSGLIPKRRNSADHAVWCQKDLLFICFWGSDNNRTTGIAHFEEQQSGLPQIKMISCAPAVEDFTQIRVFEDRLSHLAWPKDFDADKWRTAWSAAFDTGYHQVIHDSSTLTIQLAAEAQNIRDRILEVLDVESANGYVHLLLEKFRNTLIHDMTEQQFADMYAQTVVYGLFSARCMDKSQENFSAVEAVNCIPNTNPFLKSLMKECLGSENNSKLSFDELEIGDVVDLLRHTNTESIIRDFNRQTGGGREDPVIHFYEEFLTAYDKTQKVQRGVYYTPQPVVNFIVRAVDDILKNEFGIADGLASTETKTIKIKRESLRKRDGYYKQVDDTEEVPAIQILDPATGTGTFLRQAIIQIWENFKAANRGKLEAEVSRLWNEYVPQHLLPRLNGFELMMAPYAVAHMKLAMVLKETGYDFSGDERIKVFLTNSLEEPGNASNQLTFFDDPLAAESIEANRAKKNTGINVVIGNPPYSGESANKGAWIMSLMEEYKYEPGGIQRLQERNPKWLNDDYVKFIRLSQLFIERSTNGVMAFICPHGFVDNPTFRGMRWRLTNTYQKIYVLDLHGNAKKRETAEDGTKDENVFDIQQGVCIVIMVHSQRLRFTEPIVYHADLYGTRETKYSLLTRNSMSDLAWTTVNPSAPFFLFKPTVAVNSIRSMFSTAKLFNISTMGFQTHRDDFAISYNRNQIRKRIDDIIDETIPRESLLARYKVGEQFDVVKARHRLTAFSEDELNGKITLCQYRLFDERWCFLDEAFMDRPRSKVFSNVIRHDNIVFGVGRQGLAVGNIDWCLVTISRYAMDANIFRRGGVTASPLYLYSQECSFTDCTRTPNINTELVSQFEQSLDMTFVPEKGTDFSTFAPIDVIDYVYAVLHSPNYRSTYKDSLKIDYPQIPFPTSQDEFKELVSFGAELRQIHLLESPLFDDIDSDTPVAGKQPVEKAVYRDGNVYVNKHECFYDVPELAWNFYIGGYQPAQKWLKDRKGIVLSADDIKHYRKIISALMETDRIMKEIDEVFEF